MLKWNQEQRFSIYLSDSLKSKSESFSVKAFLDFKKKLDLLGENGYLAEEIFVPGDSLFAFSIEDDWIAIAHREENPPQQEQQEEGRSFVIRIMDLVTASEFSQSSNNQEKSKVVTWLDKGMIAMLAPQLVRSVVMLIVMLACVCLLYTSPSPRDA